MLLHKNRAFLLVSVSLHFGDLDDIRRVYFCGNDKLDKNWLDKVGFFT